MYQAPQSSLESKYTIDCNSVHVRVIKSIINVAHSVILTTNLAMRNNKPRWAEGLKGKSPWAWGASVWWDNGLAKPFVALSLVCRLLLSSLCETEPTYSLTHSHCQWVPIVVMSCFITMCSTPTVHMNGCRKGQVVLNCTTVTCRVSQADEKWWLF